MICCWNISVSQIDTKQIQKTEYDTLLIKTRDYITEAYKQQVKIDLLLEHFMDSIPDFDDTLKIKKYEWYKKEKKEKKQ